MKEEKTNQNVNTQANNTQTNAKVVNQAISNQNANVQVNRAQATNEAVVNNKVPQVVNTPVVDVLPKEKNNNKNGLLGILLILVVIIGFVIALPYISNMFSENYHYQTGSSTDKSSENLVDGLIPFNKVAYMKISKIKYYDFVNTTLNKINYKIIPDENIDTLSDLNIIIHLYNENKELIYTYKEDFTPLESLKRSVIDKREILLDENVYKYARYAKVTDNDNFSTIKTSYSCTKEIVINNTKINQETILYFEGSYLTSYDEIKDVYAVDKSDEDYLLQVENLNLFYNDLIKSNIDPSSINKTDNKMTFNIDVNTFDKKDSMYEVLYNSSYTDTLMKKIFEEDGYVCE